jgi:formylmethanofuran dehydrogenase subunit E
MLISSIALVIGSLLLGALIVFIVMRTENAADRTEHREAYADAKARQKNAESVANKCSQLKQEQHNLFMKHGSVHCNRCGKYTRYAESYIDHDGGCFLCKICAAKSLDKKVQHV